VQPVELDQKIEFVISRVGFDSPPMHGLGKRDFFSVSAGMQGSIDGARCTSSDYNCSTEMLRIRLPADASNRILFLFPSSFSFSFFFLVDIFWTQGYTESIGGSKRTPSNYVAQIYL
jgi:hypothetical protein